MSRMMMGTSPHAEPFWKATEEKKLVIQYSPETKRYVHYPREPIVVSPKTGEVEWREASGKGEVYAFSVMRKPGNPAMAAKVPYVVALITLEEGVRFMSNIVNCAPEDVKVGMPVKVTWEELPKGRHFPVFEPA
ncbi:MAG: OB-fold domain-containing protein [Pseudomonadota bacterium]|nr:OB-fold domain-containing protein [Pseudomonadota bacterium]